jgi:flagellar hook-associated protein 2
MINSVNNSQGNFAGFSGMASGIDTDELIKQMLGTHQSRVDKLNSEKTKFEWQQEAYQNVMTNLNDFYDKYLNVLNRENYILSNVGTKTANFTNAESASRYLDINVNADATDGLYVINEISQLAERSSVISSDKAKGAILGSENLIFSGEEVRSFNFSEGYTMDVTLDGSTRTITLDGYYVDVGELNVAIDSKLEEAFGADRITTAVDSESGKMSFSAENSIIQLRTSSNGNSLLSELGITSGDRNVANLDRSFANQFGETETIEFVINGTEFSFSSNTSIREIINEIDRSDAGVTMNYSTLSDTFTLQSKDTGAASFIEIENVSGSLFGEESYINIKESRVQNGQDAIFFLNDAEKNNPIRRSTNVFTNDGITVSLKETTSTEIEFRVGQNTDGVYEKVEDFISSYNELVSDIENLVSERVYFDYPPLTDSQKEEMSDRQIELWEEKAKSGILRNDPTLNRIVNDLKSAFWDPMEGNNSSFFEAGITTSRNYSKFEIVMDPEKLRNAISKDATGVLSLFNQQSNIRYSPRLTDSDRNERYREAGLAHRVHDIIQRNITTMRNNSNSKGILVELIGAPGDSTENNNILKRRMDQLDTRISDAVRRMTQREQLYRRQFTAMERAIQQLSSQGDAMFSMFYSE